MIIWPTLHQALNKTTQLVTTFMRKWPLLLVSFVTLIHSLIIYIKMLYIFTNFVLNYIYVQGTDMINKRFQCLGRSKRTYVSNQTKPRKKDTQAYLCVSTCWEQGIQLYMLGLHFTSFRSLQVN